MGLMAKDGGGGGDFTPVPEGTHVARCIWVVDIGNHETNWGSKHKVYLQFEIPGERVKWTDKEGKEHEGASFIGQRYTLSIGDKAILGQHLVSWRGRAFTEEERRGFDVFTVLGVPCMIAVTHSKKGDKVYANIASIMRLPKGMECPPAENELIAYTPTDADKIDNLSKLPEWLQKLCRDGHGAAADSLGSVSAPPVSHSQNIGNPGSSSRYNEQTPPPMDFDDDIPF